MKERTKLNNSEVYKLYNYLENNKDLLTGKTLVKGLVIVNRELDLKVTKFMLTRAYKDLNIFYATEKRGPKGTDKALKCQIKTLAIAVKELYEDMGSKVHPGVQDIVTLYTKE